ncbi:DUF3093 domain-containing protein [Miniimonas arenae]|uniref:DUF3093 domain-containing protein n=1 Tax=Miniimonas arenae TaxID=676201 RepID=A0A5C5BFL8_9MICO|nr:DUF3093 domain-containing protein [Miniimonas arenae]TNU76097.1 DUF3093 domain-containing protein [Miniimonas arenae]
MPPAVESADVFVERQWPSAGAWVLAPFGGLLAGLVVFPLSEVTALATAIVVTATIVLLLARTADRVSVSDGTDPGLRAGRAFLDAWHIGEVRALDAEATRHVLGPGADARAYLAHRGWIRTAVQVEVRDDADPTPYWVVSSRRADELARALQAIRPPVA